MARNVNPLEMFETAIKTMVEGMNKPISNADGGTETREPKAAGTAQFLCDKLAGAVHETLNGRTTIKRDSKGQPKFDAHGKVMVERTKGAKSYLLESIDRMQQAYDRDPTADKDWTLRTADIVSEQTEFVSACENLLKEFISLYLDASAGTVTRWEPYVDRYIADIERKASGDEPALELDAATQERRAEAAKRRDEILAKARKVA